MNHLIGEEDYLGKGIGKMIFDREGAKRIIVQPDKNNKASSSVLLSNGFILEDHIYGITKKEYCMKTNRI